MVNDKYFSRYSSYRARLPYFSRKKVHNQWLLLLIFNFPNLQYKFSTLWLLLHLNSETTYQHPIGIIDFQRHDIFQEWLCEPYLLYEWDRVLPIIASSIQADVYTILRFSEISLPRSDLFPDLIVLTSPHEHSADLIPSVFEVTLQAKKPRTLVDGKEYFWCYRWLLPSQISSLL